MSWDPVRVEFNDGTILYGMGDTTELLSRRLYHSKQKAQEAYSSSELFALVPPTLLQEAEQDAAPAHLSTTYGSPDFSWRAMHTQNAKASPTKMLMVQLPSYDEQEYR